MGNAAITSLFEKLTDEDTEVSFEKNPKLFSSLVELQNSIMEDLTRLLNTKVSVFWRDYTSRLATPFSYGVNLTCSVSAENVFETKDIESRIDKAIKQFEPRLIEARSHVIGYGNDPSILFINIDATVIIENRRTPLSFPVLLDVQ